MKNKLYICEHNVVISPKNQCIDCNYEELRDRMIKGVIFVDDNKQKIEQQSLKRKPKIVSDMLIESLIEQNKELVRENRQLKHKVDDLRSYITKCEEDISDLTKTISNSEKENKLFKSIIEKLFKEINGNPSERDYKDLEDKYNKMKKYYSELLINTINSDYKLDELESEHKSLLEKYHKMEEYLTSQEKEYNKLLDENRRITHLKKP